MIWAILAVQLCTYVALGALFYAAGNWKLGTAQLLLTGVQALLFTQ